MDFIDYELFVVPHFGFDFGEGNDFISFGLWHQQ